MKNKAFILFIAGVIVIICLLLKLRNNHSIHAESSPTGSNPAVSGQSQPQPLPIAVQVTNGNTLKANNAEQTNALTEKAREVITQQNLNEWKTPIQFYGLVEDESNDVIVGATIDFECNDLSPEGTSFYHTKSDMNGAFSIQNISGKLLRVKVNKVGYYSYQPNGAFFYYAGQNQNFVPNAGNPVVFYLREKGNGTNLIHYDKSFTLSRDGTPILIDLPSGTVMPFTGNSLKVEGWTYDSQKRDGSKYDWKCRVSVPGGGLQTNDEQFPFLAPESGYIPEDIINMPVTNDVPWSYIIRRDYYVQTSDGKFGRMVFTMVAGGGNFCEINLYFNPSGSRNLEPSQ